MYTRAHEKTPTSDSAARAAAGPPTAASTSSAASWSSTAAALMAASAGRRPQRQDPRGQPRIPQQQPDQHNVVLRLETGLVSQRASGPGALGVYRARSRNWVVV